MKNKPKTKKIIKNNNKKRFYDHFLLTKKSLLTASNKRERRNAFLDHDQPDAIALSQLQLTFMVLLNSVAAPLARIFIFRHFIFIFFRSLNTQQAGPIIIRVLRANVAGLAEVMSIKGNMKYAFCAALLAEMGPRIITHCSVKCN